MLGYGGHFLTKARRYSVTFGTLREERTNHRRTAEGVADTVTVGSLSFLGAGWLSDGDALLANTAAATRRERRLIAREELAHEAWTAGAAA